MIQIDRLYARHSLRLTRQLRALDLTGAVPDLLCNALDFSAEGEWTGRLPDATRVTLTERSEATAVGSAAVPTRVPLDLETPLSLHLSVGETHYSLSGQPAEPLAAILAAVIAEAPAFQESELRFDLGPCRFFPWHSGSGFAARADLPGGRSVLLTDLSGVRIPRSVREGAVLSAYNEDENSTEQLLILPARCTWGVFRQSDGERTHTFELTTQQEPGSGRLREATAAARLKRAGDFTLAELEDVHTDCEGYVGSTGSG